jgi:hypothetical protein
VQSGRAHLHLQRRQASQRLRHRDVSTTFRGYVHALPLDDQEAANQLARLYGLATA